MSKGVAKNVIGHTEPSRTADNIEYDTAQARGKLMTGIRYGGEWRQPIEKTGDHNSYFGIVGKNNDRETYTLLLRISSSSDHSLYTLSILEGAEPLGIPEMENVPADKISVTLSKYGIPSPSIKWP